ncbi:MAG: precorrin-6y C5,15-methyltransferase (decarboxylating) subunit CbiE [Pseudomonadales bacterium]|nr:precorrin-6y C5,15-methyltransferase (decarboxylating) subunit CbiE [Pseudomonadales bacterium]
MPHIALHIIGLGISEKAALSAEAATALQSSDRVIGWARHQKIIEPLLTCNNFTEVKKLSELQALINDASENKQSLSVLASGDPLHYGIGLWFTKKFPKEQLHFYPAVSSIQGACHKQGLALQNVTVVSLHGRPLQKIRTQLKKNRTLLILTDKNSQPQALAEECIAAGFSDSIITVHEMLGYQQEVSTSYSVRELSRLNKEFDPLHVTVMQLKGEGGVLPEFPGIPDHYYETGAAPGKGMISKREVRLVILSLMQPANGDVIWDVGAGCGGVSVELSYWNKKVNVYAIEQHAERLVYLHKNREKFGVLQNLHIVEGKAPHVFKDLPMPNKVFIGGSDGELKSLIKKAWELLPQGGCLLASGVLDSTKQQLRGIAEQLSLAQTAYVETVELSVKRGFVVNQKMDYEVKRPIELFKFTKGQQR